MALRLNNLKVGYKIALLVTVFVVALGSVSSIAVLTSQAVKKSLVLSSANLAPAVDSVVQADRDLQQALVAERTLLVLMSGTKEFEAQLQAVAENVQQAQERAAGGAELSVTSTQKAALAQFQRDLEQWLEVNRRVISLLQLGTDPARAEARELEPLDGCHPV